MSKRARGHEEQQENKVLEITVIKALKNSQKLRQHAQWLQGSIPDPLHMSDAFQFSVFIGVLIL